MRVALEFNGIQVRGAAALREPLVWPVWFAVDGDAMRALLGDVTASSWVHAPGPQAGADTLGWNRTLVPSGLPESSSGVGLALLYTEGGKSSAATRAQYEAFSERVREIALDAAAEASGLTSLFPFRGGARLRTPNIDQLRKGVEHDILLSPEADGDASNDDAAAAFAYVARLLAPLAPGNPVQRDEVTPPATPVEIDPRIMHPVRPIAPLPPFLPGLETLPGRVQPIPGRMQPIPGRVQPIPGRVLPDPGGVRPAPAARPLDEGTVAASLIQFWPVATDARPGIADIRRALPTRTKLRDTLSASLTLNGRLRREG